MPKGLLRIYGQGDWHYINCSCYRRLPFLEPVRNRDLFLWRDGAAFGIIVTEKRGRSRVESNRLLPFATDHKLAPKKAALA
jgi:hypothetical protein